MPQGKALGGGSILNAMCWNRGGKDDYDAWEALGNPGWNWGGMLPYFIKVSARKKNSLCYNFAYRSEERDVYARIL